MSTFTKGEKAPGFALVTPAGKNISLGDALARGPVVAGFFKVSCPTCQFTFPFVERLYQQFGDGSVTILGVSQDDGEATRKFAARYGISFPLLIDPPPYATSIAYHLRATPTLYLIAQDGAVELASEGFSKQDLLAIQQALAAKAAGASATALFRTGERIPEYKPG